jgi:phosphoribosylanthranilate isomerase
MKIKVCGLKDPRNIEAVAALKPDYMGFICYDVSPRFIADMPADTLEFLPYYINKTAVFVDEDAETISALIYRFGFDAIQLHGDEGPDFAGSFRDRVKVIKAFGLDEGFNFEQLNDYVHKVDYFLFDTKTTLRGGSGKTFDWEILNNYTLDIPFFLSGGISLDNLEELKNINHPQFYGVDLNSKFEISPGLKDIEKLKQAFNVLKLK